MLRNADWQLFAGCSEQPIGRTLQTLEDGIDGLPRNDSNYETTLRQFTKQPRPHLHGSGSLKSRFVLIIVPVTIRTKNIRKTTKNFRIIYEVFFQVIGSCVFTRDFIFFSGGIT
jgi:hypothetical protein